MPDGLITTEQRLSELLQINQAQHLVALIYYASQVFTGSLDLRNRINVPGQSRQA